VVLEHLIPEAVIERKPVLALVLAVVYSTVSILIARILFPANSGIVSVIFLSIFLIPYFSDLLKREERQEEREKSWSIRRLVVDNKETYLTYLFLFVGVYLTYMLYSFGMHKFGLDTGVVFREQLSLESLRGGAAFSSAQFWAIFLNNWWVLLACFLIALVAGDGAVFFIAWNASTWGTIFGYRAVEASLTTGQSALWLLLLVLLITLPHVLLEGTAYIISAIAGGIISDDVVRRSKGIGEFIAALLFGAAFLIVVYFVLRVFLSQTALGICTIIVALWSLHFLQHLFSVKRERLVVRYNVYLFAIAVGIFFVAAIIETLVLLNSSTLRNIYLAAAG